LRDLRSLRDPADLIARYRHSAAPTRKWLHALVSGIACRRIWHKLCRAVQSESAPSRLHMCRPCLQLVNAAPFLVHTLQCGRKDLFSVERHGADVGDTDVQKAGGAIELASMSFELRCQCPMVTPASGRRSTKERHIILPASAEARACARPEPMATEAVRWAPPPDSPKEKINFA